jgi:HSP20 family protein
MSYVAATGREAECSPVGARRIPDMTFHSLIPRRFVSRAPAAPSLRAFWPADFDRLFDEAYETFAFPTVPQAAARFAPRVDVTESDEAYSVQADLPGLDEKDIQVSLEEGVLSIQGKLESEKDEKKSGVRWVERARGSFHRAIELPAEVDAAKVTASYRQGVLTVTLPKLPAAKPEVRAIPITTS